MYIISNIVHSLYNTVHRMTLLIKGIIINNILITIQKLKHVINEIYTRTNNRAKTLSNTSTYFPLIYESHIHVHA